MKKYFYLILSVLTLGLMSSCSNDDDPILVQEITLDKVSAELNVGETLTLTAKVTPENANDKHLAWSSSDEAVATVSPEGVVSAVGVGKAIIKVAANDKSGKFATCEVTVKSKTKVYEADLTSFRGAVYDGESITINGVVISVLKGSIGRSTTSPGNGTDWMGNGPTNCFKIATENNETITKIEITVTGSTFDFQGDGWTQTDPGYVWTGSDTSVTTLGGYCTNITKVTVTVEN